MSAITSKYTVRNEQTNRNQKANIDFSIFLCQPCIYECLFDRSKLSLNVGCSFCVKTNQLNYRNKNPNINVRSISLSELYISIINISIETGVGVRL